MAAIQLQVAAVLFTLISSLSTAAVVNDFTQCVSGVLPASSSIGNVIFKESINTYAEYLAPSIKNQRFANTTKPDFIIVPTNESHVQATVLCCKRLGLELRVMSGGHSYEGLSYVSQQPYVVMNMMHYNATKIDLASKTAWVQAGATTGEVHYAVSKMSKTLAPVLPLCPSVGTGGTLGGGVMSPVMRKYGLGADNVIDALIVNADGKILNKSNMGDELFWAIRGGGAASFGVVLAWQIKLVEVPPVVTVFTVTRTTQEGATEIVYKWQFMAEKCDQNLFVRILFQAGGNRTVNAVFSSLFLGNKTGLLNVMGNCLPELALQVQDCHEMNWVQSVVYIGSYPHGSPVQALLGRDSPMGKYAFKAKSHFVSQYIPKNGIDRLLQTFLAEQSGLMVWEPLGGILNEIPASALPFPYRNGTLYNVQYVATLKDVTAPKKPLDWLNKIYALMSKHIQKSTAYYNYIDLDLGVNSKNHTDYSSARQWGESYFKHNFRRLSSIKSKIDPQNFFWHEQSIPPL